MRSNADHDDWRKAMRLAWRDHPFLTFFISQGNDIVAIGGWAKPEMNPPANDRFFTAFPQGEVAELIED